MCLCTRYLCIVVYTTDLIVSHTTHLRLAQQTERVSRRTIMQRRTGHTKLQLRHVDQRKKEICTVMGGNDHPLPT